MERGGDQRRGSCQLEEKREFNREREGREKRKERKKGGLGGGGPCEMFFLALLRCALLIKILRVLCFFLPLVFSNVTSFIVLYMLMVQVYIYLFFLDR